MFAVMLRGVGTPWQSSNHQSDVGMGTCDQEFEIAIYFAFIGTARSGRVVDVGLNKTCSQCLAQAPLSRQAHRPIRLRWPVRVPKLKLGLTHGWSPLTRRWPGSASAMVSTHLIVPFLLLIVPIMFFISAQHWLHCAQSVSLDSNFVSS
jgi:hypothetical protein